MNIKKAVGYCTKRGKTRKQALHLGVASLMITFLLVLLGAGNTFAADVDVKETQSNNDIETYLHELESDNSFGGIYYDGDTLIINYVKSSNSLAVPYGMVDVDIEYRAVEYPIRLLEEVKEYLIPMMDEYNIYMLDANEMTNQVDIALSDFSEEKQNNVIALVNEQFGNTDFLNFINAEGYTVATTIAYEGSGGVASEEIADLDIARSYFSAFSGMEIKVNSMYLTLGPATSATQAYTAGHAFQGYGTVVCRRDVYVTNGVVEHCIGQGVGYLGNGHTDWATISSNGSTFAPIVKTDSPTMGKPIYMWGARSGITAGTITRTGISVGNLNGMCAGSYSCQQGDSGAGIFDAQQSPSIAYGIQSGMGLINGTWVESYFSPFPVS